MGLYVLPSRGLFIRLSPSWSQDDRNSSEAAGTQAREEPRLVDVLPFRGNAGISRALQVTVRLAGAARMAGSWMQRCLWSNSPLEQLLSCLGIPQPVLWESKRTRRMPQARTETNVPQNISVSRSVRRRTNSMESRRLIQRG